GTLPLSVTLATEKIYETFYAEFSERKAFLHSHSFTGNPIACRAALATLELFDLEKPIAANVLRAQAMWAYTAELRSHRHVAEVRQQGMILAIELARNVSARQPYQDEERRGLRVYQHALAQGVLLRPLGNVVYFMPPYVISPKEIERMCQVAIEAIHAATRD
ncbi:MAG: aminotransferase class III-fold pyridoxal phosphate-dependent enzyme, partial [Burkholderiales bacterium]